MSTNLVYPAYRWHKTYRDLTRDNDIQIGQNKSGEKWVFHMPKNVLRSSISPDVPLSYQLTQDEIDSWFINTSGINLCGGGLEQSRGIRPGGVRLGPVWGWQLAPQAFEPLLFGVGIFRSWHTRQNSGYDCVMGIPAKPKISSNEMRVFMFYIVPYGTTPDESRPWLVNKEIFESTNLILADSYGEMEQLMRRRAEVGFLETYLHEMQLSAEFHERRGTRDQLTHPDCFDNYSEEIVRAWLRHIGFGVWKRPPSTINELLERAEFLLKCTVIDENPLEVITRYEHLNLWSQFTGSN